MNGYTVIDRENWPRKEYFDHYLTAVPCTYSMTVKLDITNIRRQRLKLYPAMLFCIAQAVNRTEQFRMAFRPNGELVRYDQMHPSYTVFHPETETFSNLWTAWSADYPEFCRRYEEDARRFGAVSRMDAKPGQPENCFTVSMIPWRTFDGFNLNIDGYRYLIPIFTLGRFQEADGRCLIPLAVQVHHAVCDGFHLCRFLDRLEESVNTLTAEKKG